MKTKMMALMLLAAGSMFAQTRVSIGVGIGDYGRGYPSTPPYAQTVPPCPGPDYSWVDGYWVQDRGRDTWVPGYWERQQYSAGYQVAPGYDSRYNERYGRQIYDRNSWRDRDRDFDGDRHRDRDGGHEGNRYQNRGNVQNYHCSDGYQNGFRNH